MSSSSDPGDLKAPVALSDFLPPKKSVPKFNFVSRIRGARDVHSLTAQQFTELAQSKRKGSPSFTIPSGEEHFKGETIVHPYYDFDAKYKTIPVGEERVAEETARLVEFQGIVTRLHPGKEVVYGQRHGAISKGPKEKHVWKISYRAWVQGVKVPAAQIPLHIKAVLGQDVAKLHPSLDLSVYKGKEQLLGVVYGCKDIDTVKRYLQPISVTNGDTEALPKFLAQNVSEDDELLKVTGGQGVLSFDANKKAPKAQKKAKAKTPKENGDPPVASSGGSSSTEVLHGDSMTSSSEKLTRPSYDGVLDAASEFFGYRYRMQEKLLTIIVNHEERWLIFPTTAKWCYILKGNHQSNNSYITVTESGSRWKCPDEECKKIGDVKIIPFVELPQEICDLFTKIFFGSVDVNLMGSAKTECKKSITENFPNENIDELEVGQTQHMLTTLAKKQHCHRCKSCNIQFEHTTDGWLLRCRDCFSPWPTKPVPIGDVEFPNLMSALTQLNVIVNYNKTVNLTQNVTQNITNIGESSVEFYADYGRDQLTVFDDTDKNALFIGALQGTDTTLSRFTTLHFRDQFHCTEERNWYKFEGHCWRENAADLAYKEAMNEPVFLGYFQKMALHFESRPIQNEETKKKARMLRKLCVSLEDGSRREKIVTDSVMKFHKFRPDFSEELNTQNVMVFKDGVFDFDTFTFGPGTPERAITMRVPQNYVEFDADNEHVRFLMNFLSEILPDPLVCDYALKIMGIALTQDTSQQYFWILTGSGGNGKGKLMTLLEECLGDYYQAVSPALLTRRREDANQANEALMSLRDARLAVFQEPEKSEVLQAGTVKAITGEDTMSTRANYGKQVKFKPKFKSMFVTNTIPAMSESTLALWRRVRIIHFPTAFVEDPTEEHEKKIDFHLDRKLKEAAPYFISILIEYYRRYKTEGLCEPPAVQEATNQHKASVAAIKEFVELHLQRDESTRVNWVSVMNAYTKWAKGNVFDQKTLTVEFKKCGLVRVKTNMLALVNPVKGQYEWFDGFKGWKLKMSSDGW